MSKDDNELLPAQVKNIFLEEYAEDPATSVEEAAQTAGKTANQIYRMKNKDPEFRRKFEKIRSIKLRERSQSIEDQMFDRIQDGEFSLNHGLDLMKYLDRKIEKRAMSEEESVFSEEEIEKIRRNMALEFLESFGIEVDIITDGRTVQGIKLRLPNEQEKKTVIRDAKAD